MFPRLSRFFIAVLAMLLVVATGSASVHQAFARPRVADFAAPYSPAEAAARVAAAREASARRYAAPPTDQQAVDPNGLPLSLTLYFPQTGHHLSNRSGFLDFWRANGQVLLFGYPITEEFVEQGRIVQYFERVRFEFHPEQEGQVWLGLLGRELFPNQADGPFQGIADPQNGALYFPETSHSLWGEFQRYWERRGGLDVFGYPISEEFDENGQTVQYFERARFVYNPGDMDPFYRSMEQYNGITLSTLHEVELGDLGRQVAQARNITIDAVPRLDGTVDWTPALWLRHIEVDLSAQWLTAYEGETAVYHAPVATGRDGFNTPTGSYAVYAKYPMQTMTGSAGGETWYVPDIPWVMYVVGGVALHGTYWHNAFGTGVRMSHGCINLGMDDAQWLYEWAEVGTTVTIRY